MKNKRNSLRHTAVWILSALACCALLAGCGSTEDGSSGSANSSEERQLLTDVFAGIILTSDESSAVIDTVIEDMAAYAESESDVDLLILIETLQEASDRIDEIQDAYTYEDALEDFIEILEAEEISELDYTTFAEMVEDDIVSCQLDIYEIENAVIGLYNGDCDMDYFTTLYELLEEKQTILKQYGWYMYVNYWFADWEGDDLDYVQGQILAELDSYDTAGLEWDDDRDSIEIRANAILDNLESVKNEWDAFTESVEAAEETEETIQDTIQDTE